MLDRIARRLNPAPSRRLVAEPGQLTLGVIARGLAGRLNRRRQRRLPRQMGRELAHADRLHRGQGGIETAGDQPDVLVAMNPAAYDPHYHFKLAIDAGVAERLKLNKRTLPIKSVRQLRKKHMVRNDALPWIEVDPQTFEVRADGKLLMCPPASRVPLARRYMLR